MANPKWVNKYLTTKPEVHQIFDDLDAYREFCVAYGRVFNEAALYNERDRDYSDFLKFKERGYAKNAWNWAHSPERKPWEKKPYTPGGPGNGERKGYQGNNFRANYKPGVR